MSRKYIYYILIILASVFAHAVFAQGRARIVVDLSGKGDFTSIQAAINSLSDSSATPRLILIRKGTYNEKLLITRHNIILQGEDRDRTVITQDIARDEWRCDHPDDWGVATININGNDITLKDLTIANDYGFHQSAPRTIACAPDTPGHSKMVAVNGHQMALRTITATRLRAINCHFRSMGGDTVSPWNLADGMFYFKDCSMEGSVDLYCPRGWAWAEHCRFYASSGPAIIWHDGSGNADFKTVLKDCSFDGYAGFNLGRYHKDAQFFLIGCHFSKNMADRDIYQVPTSNQLQFGRRVYYAGCHRDSGDFAWFADNLGSAPGAPSVADVRVEWLFRGKWRPEE